MANRQTHINKLGHWSVIDQPGKDLSISIAFSYDEGLDRISLGGLPVRAAFTMKAITQHIELVKYLVHKFDVDYLITSTDDRLCIYLTPFPISECSLSLERLELVEGKPFWRLTTGLEERLGGA